MTSSGDSRRSYLLMNILRVSS